MNCKKTFLCMLFCTLFVNVQAQQTGKVEYPALGISFNIPQGWVGQESDYAYVMGSETIAGLIIVLTNEAKSLSDLEQYAASGIRDDAGTNLELRSELENVGSNIVGGVFEGTLEWSPAKGFITGIINPFGSSVTVATLTSNEAYSDLHKQLSIEVSKSVAFEKPRQSELVKEWNANLSGARLNYSNSNSSGGSTYYNSDGTASTSSSSFSDRATIDLCPEGYFNFSSSSSSSFDASGGSGNFGGSSKGAGTWKVVGDAHGNPILVLSFHNGEEREYEITSDGGKTFLNGSRYYRTYGTYRDDGPQCW